MSRRSSFDDQTRWEAHVGSLRIQARHHALIAAADIEPGMRVLDLASGRGETAVLAARAGARVHATDIGPPLVQAILTNANEAGARITASLADMRNLTGLAGGFDRILGCAALHHLDEAGSRSAVLGVMKLLAPDGRALFLEPTENIAWFDFVKHMVPGPMQPHGLRRRPSILNRRAWRAWLETRDDRWMSDTELLSLWPNARIVRRFGLLRRFIRSDAIEPVDAWLVERRWLGRFAQATIVEYRL